MATEDTTRIGRFLAGTLGLNGTAGGDAEAAGALSNPAASAMLGIIAAFAGGAAAVRGSVSDEQQATIRQIQSWLEQQLKERSSLADALASYEAEYPATDADTVQRIGQLHQVFDSGIDGIGDRIGNATDLGGYVRDSMAMLDERLSSFSEHLGALIDSSIQQGSVDAAHVAMLMGVDRELDATIETQAKDRAARERDEVQQLSDGDLAELEQRLLISMRGESSVGGVEAGDDDDLARGVRRAIQHAVKEAGDGARGVDQVQPVDVFIYLSQMRDDRLNAALQGQLQEAEPGAASMTDEELQQERELAAIAEATGHMRDASEAINRVLAERPDDQRALMLAGHIQKSLGRADAAEAFFRLVLENADDPASKAIAMGNIAASISATSPNEESAAKNKDALAIVAEANRPDIVAWLHTNIGVDAAVCGDFEEAKARLQTAVGLYEEHSIRAGYAKASENLGGVLHMMGESQDGLRHLQVALDEYGAMQQAHGVVTTLTKMASILSLNGQLDEASEAFRSALDLAEMIRDDEAKATIHVNLGIIESQRGDLAKGEAAYREALRINESLGRASGQAHCCANLGFSRRAQGDAEDARQFLERARDLYKALGSADFVERMDAELASL